MNVEAVLGAAEGQGLGSGGPAPALAAGILVHVVVAGVIAHGLSVVDPDLILGHVLGGEGRDAESGAETQGGQQG